MAYRIELTKKAMADIAALKVFDRKRVVDGIEAQLVNEPAVETRNRKRLRPNGLAEWELRIGIFRVFYDVPGTNDVVKVVAVGYKVGNALYIQGKRFEL